MQITVKTTQNKIHKVFTPQIPLVFLLSPSQIDVEPTESVGQLKAKIEAAHGYPAATQKVIYSGIQPRAQLPIYPHFPPRKNTPR
jgi:UV excision repair protein RAD23